MDVCVFMYKIIIHSTHTYHFGCDASYICIHTVKISTIKSE